VKFKRENIEIGKTGVKKINTGKVLSIIDPSTLQSGDYIGRNLK